MLTNQWVVTWLLCQLCNIRVGLNVELLQMLLSKFYTNVLQWQLIKMRTRRGSHQRCSIKRVFLTISQNSQENTCPRAFLKPQYKVYRKASIFYFKAPLLMFSLFQKYLNPQVRTNKLINSIVYHPCLSKLASGYIL